MTEVFGFRLPSVYYAVAGGPAPEDSISTTSGTDGTDDQTKKPSQKKYEAPAWLVAFVIVIVTLIWAATFLSQIFNPDYNPPAEVHFVFLGVLAVVFGTQFVKGLHRD